MERLGSDNGMMYERYERHIRLSQIGLAGQEKLKKASVLIIGVGGLGSPISLYLAAAGVGRIGIIDSDTVSVSNLQRQVLYTEDQVGSLKVSCARDRLLQANSELIVDAYPFRLTSENAEELIDSYDIVVDGCDNFATRYLIDDCCKKLTKPYVYGSIGEFHGQVSVFNYKDGISYRDLFPEPLTTDVSLPQGVMGVVPGVVGTLEAAEVIKIITGIGKLLVRQLLTIDILTMEMQVISL
ncbi:MAG: HesA/MoeB/ThiF family protein [Bacteroidales bacterium]